MIRIFLLLLAGIFPAGGARGPIVSTPTQRTRTRAQSNTIFDVQAPPRRRSSVFTPEPRPVRVRPSVKERGVTRTKLSNDAVSPSKVSPKFVQTGTVTISLSSASRGTGAVTFDTTFDSTPRVLVSALSASAGNADAWNASAASTSTTGFTCGIRHVDGTTATVDVTVQWMAVDVS